MRSLQEPLLVGCLLVVGATAQGAGAFGPEIFVSVRGAVDGVVEQGEPLRIAVRLAAPRGSVVAFRLAPARGSWVDAVVVELTSLDARKVLARGVVVAQPASPTAVLDAEHVAGGMWRFAAASTQQLAPGDYLVRARLMIGSGSGWTGEAEADGAELHLVKVQSGDPVQRAVNFAQDALLDARVEAAAAILDEAMKLFPDESRLLLLRGEVSLRAGNWPAAAICASRWHQISSGHGDGPPPTGWYELESRIDLARDAAPSANEPPPWSWPRQVMGAFTRTVIEQRNPTSEIAAVSPAPAASAPVAPPESGNASFAGSVVPPADLGESKILADADGQWAASARAGTEYGTPAYGAVQLVGPPDVPDGNDNPKAWCHSSSATGLEWIEVTFGKPVSATAVRVRQSYNPGAIVRVEAIDTTGAAHLWWQGVDPERPPGALNAIAWFAVRVPKTDYLVASIKLTLDLDAVTSWQEIDAVQLVGAPQ